MGVRGPSKKPHGQRKAEGNRIQQDRYGGTVDAHGVGGSPKTPRGMTKRQREFYDEITTHMPPGVLSGMDSVGMSEMVRWYEVYSVLMDKLQKAPTDAQLMNATKKAFDSFVKIADRYGWTPGSRADIKMPQGAAETDPQADIISRMAG